MMERIPANIARNHLNDGAGVLAPYTKIAETSSGSLGAWNYHSKQRSGAFIAKNAQVNYDKMSDSGMVSNILDSRSDNSVSGLLPGIFNDGNTSRQDGNTADGLDLLDMFGKSIHINYQQAEKAFHSLLFGDDKNSTGKKPSLHECMNMDPFILAVMVNTVMQETSSQQVQSLCKQVDTSTQMTNFQRDRRIHEYQKQLQESIEQADKARKAGIFGAIFDWVISAIEIVVGIVKMAQGVLSNDPTSIASGVAYVGAGVSGFVKIGAKIAELCGADEAQCEKVIDGATKGQQAFEGIAMALDIVKMGMVFNEARSIGKIAVEALENKLTPEITKALSTASTEEIENFAKELADEITQEVTNKFSENIEREMVEIEQQEAEAASFNEQIDKKMASKMGKNLARDNIRELTYQAIFSALKKDVELAAEDIVKLVSSTIRSSIARTIIAQSMNQSLAIVRGVVASSGQLTSGIIKLQNAGLQKKINDLTVDMGLADFMISWLEQRMKFVEKKLEETYQTYSDSQRMMSSVIEGYGSALCRIAGNKL